MKTMLLAGTILISHGLTLFGETLNGHLMPSKCKNEDPKTHGRTCALLCQSTGFGILTESGQYVSFNADGNTKAMELLRSTEKKSDLRVSVEGTRQGAVLAVKSVVWK